MPSIVKGSSQYHQGKLQEHKMKKHMDIDEALKKILITEGASTQEEICEKLSLLGVKVTQSSVSRWLRRVGAIKISSDQGTRYALPPSSDEVSVSRLVSSIQHNAYLIVIRTLPGSASWIAGLLDKNFSTNLLGTLAGDDTIFATPKEGVCIKQMAQEIENFLLIFSN